MAQDPYAPQANDGPDKVNKIHLDLIKHQQEENRKARQDQTKKKVIAPSDVTVPGPVLIPAAGGHVAPPVSKQVAEFVYGSKPVNEQPPESANPQNPEADANKPPEQK